MPRHVTREVKVFGRLLHVQKDHCRSDLMQVQLTKVDIPQHDQHEQACDQPSSKALSCRMNIGLYWDNS